MSISGEVPSVHQWKADVNKPPVDCEGRLVFGHLEVDVFFFLFRVCFFLLLSKDKLICIMMNYGSLFKGKSGDPEGGVLWGKRGDLKKNKMVF